MLAPSIIELGRHKTTLVDLNSYKSVACLFVLVTITNIKGDLQTICRFSYMKVYKLITLGTKFKNLLSLGGKITMFSKFITNYIEQG